MILSYCIDTLFFSFDWQAMVYKNALNFVMWKFNRHNLGGGSLLTEYVNCNSLKSCPPRSKTNSRSNNSCFKGFIYSCFLAHHSRPTVSNRNAVLPCVCRLFNITLWYQCLLVILQVFTIVDRELRTSIILNCTEVFLTEFIP